MLKKITEIPLIMGCLSVGLFFPALAAMFVGNEVALMLGFDSETYAADFCRGGTLVVFFAISIVTIYKVLSESCKCGA